MRVQVDFSIAFFQVGQVPATRAEFYECNDVFHKPLVVSIHPFLGIELGEKYQNERLFPWERRGCCRCGLNQYLWGLDAVSVSATSYLSKVKFSSCSLSVKHISNAFLYSTTLSGMKKKMHLNLDWTPWCSECPVWKKMYFISHLTCKFPKNKNVTA